MTSRWIYYFWIVAVASTWPVTACHREGPSPGEEIVGPGVVNEAEHQVVILDRSLRGKFSFERPWTRRVDNDRLQVIVRIRNRTNYTQNVDISTVFRDEVNAPLNDQTAWTRLIFGPNETKSYMATSIDRRAHNFTVRLREGL